MSFIVSAGNPNEDAQLKIMTIVILLLVASLLVNVVFYREIFNQRKHYDQGRLSPLGLDSYPKLEEPTKFLLYGDSHAFYWKKFPLPHKNYGIGGQTSEQILLRLDHHIQTQELENVLLFAGTNDLKSILSLPHLQDQIIQDAIKNIKTMTTRIKAKNIYVFTAPPTFYLSFMYRLAGGAQYDKLRQKFNEQLKQSFKDQGSIQIIDVDLALEGLSLKKCSFDGVHMNSEAYEKLMAYLYAKM